LAILRPRERGLRRGANVWLRVITGSAQCLRLSERFFHSFFNQHRPWLVLECKWKRWRTDLTFALLTLLSLRKSYSASNG